MRSIAMMVLATVLLAGCANVVSQEDDPWTGRAADPTALNNGWKGGEALLLGTLGRPTDGETAPGPIDADPLLVDIDGDGTSEVVAQSHDRHLYVWRLDGTQLAKLRVPYPPSWHLEKVLNAPTAGVMRSGEPVTLVVATPAAYVMGWRFDPGASTHESFQFQEVFRIRTDGCHRSPGMDGGATLADLDGDGELEILAQTEQVGLFAYETDGSEKWRQCWGGGNSAPVADDLDGDGRLEAIFASDAGFLSVLDGRTGDPRWTFDARATGLAPASVPMAPTVAELDGVAPKEIVFIARNAPIDDEAMFSQFHMAVFAVHQNPLTYQAQLFWTVQPEWAHPMSNTRLIAADPDGDGRDDLWGMDWNTIGHSPGAWEVLGPGHAFRMDGQGNTIWHRPLETWWSNKAVALVDADGDGTLELLVNAPNGDHDAIWRLDAMTGKPEGFLTLHPWQAATGPVIGENEGRLVVGVAGVDSNEGKRGAVLAYDLGVQGRGT